jgi:HNH endonuclease
MSHSTHRKRDVDEDRQLAKTLIERHLDDAQIQAMTGLGIDFVAGVRRAVDITEQLSGGAKLAQVGRLHGVSQERVRQIAGSIGWRQNQWRNSVNDANRQSVIELCQARKSDEEIAAQLQLKLFKVKELRQQAGIKRPRRDKQWTQPEIIKRARLWYETFQSLAAIDWNPSWAKSHGTPERAERFYRFRDEHGCPYSKQVQKEFGSWSEMLRRAGLPVNPRGRPAKGLWKRGGLPQ